MGKLETLVVPEELGVWLEDIGAGNLGTYFTMIDALSRRAYASLGLPLSDFIYNNKKELIEVILGSREYKIEEPLYYALVKGHERINGSFRYWNVNTSNNRLFVGGRLFKNSKYLTKMSKSEWSKLGINEDNADFVKVEDL